MNKKLIHDRFSKNLKTYNENAKIQKRMAEKLLTFLQNKAPKNILEIGCGTGFLTKLIDEKLIYENFTAVDIVEDCYDYVKEINPNIIFFPDDIELFLEKNKNKFDLIISNASLQWVNDFENIIKTLKDRLNPNGELVFSTFGKENFREIYHVMGTSLNYYSTQQLESILPNSIIDSEIHVMSFATPRDVLKHLQATGVNAIENISWTKKDLIKFENGYQNLCCGRATLTYNPVYINFSKN